MYRDRVGNAIELNYRAVDAQAAPSPPPLTPSGYNYSTEQAIRVGHMVPGTERIHENIQNPLLDREAIQRELEKEKIRAEIIASDIARRCQLEAAEVRREMMPERELALPERGYDVSGRFSFLPAAGTKIEPSGLSFGQVEGWSLEERFGSGKRQGY